MDIYSDEWVVFGIVGGAMIVLFVICVCCCDGAPEEYVGRAAVRHQRAEDWPDPVWSTGGGASAGRGLGHVAGWNSVDPLNRQNRVAD